MLIKILLYIIGIVSVSFSLTCTADIPTSFDLRRSANSELDSALRKARIDKKTGVMVIIGNNNCQDCIHLLNHLNALESELIESIFEIVVIPKDANNKRVFENIPATDILPHIYILATSGDLLWSQHTDALKKDNFYNEVKLNQFITIWQKIHNGEGYISTNHPVGGKDDIGPPKCGPVPGIPCTDW